MELFDAVLPGMSMALFAFYSLALDVDGLDQEKVTLFGLQVSFD